MLPELGASLAVQHASSYRVVAAGDTATMHEHVPDQSELRCGFVLELSSCPTSGAAASTPRRRWSVGSDATQCWLQVMESFDTVLVVLGMLLLHASSTYQVLLTPLAQPACTQRSPTADCAPWVAGGCRTLPFDVVSMAVKQQSSAVAWWHAGAHAVHRAPASVCRQCPERPGTRSGRPLTVEPDAPGHLAEPYGPTAELGGLGSTRVAGVGT